MRCTAKCRLNWSITMVVEEGRGCHRLRSVNRIHIFFFFFGSVDETVVKRLVSRLSCNFHHVDCDVSRSPI